MGKPSHSKENVDGQRLAGTFVHLLLTTVKGEGGTLMLWVTTCELGRQTLKRNRVIHKTMARFRGMIVNPRNYKTNAQNNSRKTKAIDVEGKRKSTK